MNVKVNVKWNKELFKDVEVDLTEPPEMFKIQLMSLTGVPIERQKILGKGGMIQNDAWGKVTLKDGMTVMLMGSADEAKLPVKAEEPQFVEDLPEQEQETVDTRQYGAGLANLGNTCYMNACLQCLYKVPELHGAMTTPPATTSTHMLTREGSRLFQEMGKGIKGNPYGVSPYGFWEALRREVPHFDELCTSKEPGQPRGHRQQDAEECWTAILSKWRPALARDGVDIISNLFKLCLRVTLNCTESDETTVDTVDTFSLKCNITQEVNFLSDGIRLGLVEDREKRSEALDRVVAWRGTAELTSLPPYLTVQNMRFFYKVQAQMKAKIARKVAYPIQLDIFDFCTDELKSELKGPRAAHKRLEDAKAGIKPEETKDGDGATDSDGDALMGEPADYTGALTGRYDLLSVLTHKGRSPDSGHYVAWIKQEDGSWVQFDDDTMIPRKDEDVLGLCGGGGDWHTAYMMLWRAQRVPEGPDGAAPLAD